LDELIGRTIVVDTQASYVYVGVMERTTADAVVLRDVDAHDLRDTPNATREQYLVRCRELGVVVNRTRVWIARGQIVSVSSLDDIVVR
jgi:hypothetical protein